VHAAAQRQGVDIIMSKSSTASWRQILLGFGALLLVSAVAVAIVWGLSRVLTGTVGGAVAGGLVGLVVALASKSFEHQKHHEAAIAEKKREVYRRLLSPWERVMVDSKAGKRGDDALANVDLASVYSSAFDAVLYGSEAVVQRYVEFRSPNPSRDAIDTMRALAALLVAMREDVTGKKATLPVEAVLGTFMNFSQEELLALRLREYVARHPEAQQKLAQVLAGSGSAAGAGPAQKPAG
jgi:hypothetical protein